ILVDPPKSQGIPFQPWAKALQEYRHKVTSESEDPASFCIPLAGSHSYTRGGVHPIEFIQLPEQKRILQLMEFPGHNWRDIFLDGRSHPSKQELEEYPTFMGHSIGHWEGATLVVDTVGFNEGTWIDKEGHPHTSQLHVIEKLARTSINNLHIEATFEDPGAYTRPGPLLSIWPGVRIGRSRNTFANRTTAIRITTSRQQRGPPEPEMPAPSLVMVIRPRGRFLVNGVQMGERKTG